MSCSSTPSTEQEHKKDKEDAAQSHERVMDLIQIRPLSKPPSKSRVEPEIY